MKRQNYFVVVGLPRSGTSLIQKFLNYQKNITCYYQPFSHLYLKVLREFFKIKKISKKNIKYPANSILINKKLKKEFNKYIKNYEINFESKKFFLNNKNKIKPCTDLKVKNIQKSELFSNFFKKTLYYNSSDLFVGTKEIFGEDFIENYINSNVKVIGIIRNPYDMIYSILKDKKQKFIKNKNYNTTFLIKRWVKCQTLFRFYRKKKNFLYIDFDKIIINKNKELTNLINFIKDTKSNKKNYNENFKFNNSSNFKNLQIFDPRVIGLGKKNLEQDIKNKILKYIL